MKTLFPLLLFAAMACSSALPLTSSALMAQDAKPDPQKERADWIRTHYTKYEYRIPMRDGKKLFTAVYVPNEASASKKFPILMMRTPYSVAPYGLDRYRGRLGPSQDFEKDGYIFVFQDVRGRHMSEGTFVNMTPHRSQKKTKDEIDESSDTYDTIDWLLKTLPYHNGKVGQRGISYPGFYTAAGAIDSHPALKAISPQAPIADWWRGDDMHRWGAFNLQMAFAFFSDFARVRQGLWDEEERRDFDYGTFDAYQFYLDLGPLSLVNGKYFKDEVPFWNEVAAHPNYDKFWQERNLLPHLKGVKAAVLTVGGWYDTEDLYGPLQIHKAIEKNNKGPNQHLVIGPWTHGAWERNKGDRVGDTDFGFATSEMFQKVQSDFFKHHLKGGEDPRLPKAMIFETGANRWRNFEQWPPAQAKPKDFFLKPAGQLDSTAESTADVRFDAYPSDPAKPVPYTTEIGLGWSSAYAGADQRFAARRPDVLVYQTEELKEDVTVAGPLSFDLWFSTSASDADIVVKLIDAWPGKPRGVKADSEQAKTSHQQLLVRGEPMRARFRDSWEEPKPFAPGEPTRIRFTANDVMHTFQRGHRIMLQIQSSWFPFIDRNPQTFVPNIFQAQEKDFVKAEHRIYRSSQYPSRMTLPILPN